jgi:dTDP-4-dehydrorhamnose reductase
VRRVLLIGGAGQLGTAIRRRWQDCAIAAPSRVELDLEDTAQLEAAMDRIGADLLVNAAAFHDVDRCEEEPQRALEVNAFAVERAARLARDRDVVFVTLSTDYVFDGATNAPYTERDTPRPLSVYARSKLEGERLVEGVGAPAFVVRTCGLYGEDAANAQRRPFIDRLLTHRGAAPMRVVDDVIASPTFTGDLADALRQLVETRAYGLYHAVNIGAVSWYDFACEAVRQAGAVVAIEPISAAQWKARALRPRFSALENAKLRTLGMTMPPWQAGIAAYLALRLR